MRVFVAGGTGFTGGRVVADLVKGGHAVTCLVRAGGRAEALDGLPVTVAEGDLGDGERLAGLLPGHDAFVNVASLGFGHAPGIVRAAETAGLERAIFFSTTAIFTSLPAASRAVRLAAERTIRSSRLAWTILRPTMIYGAPGDRNVERLLRAVASWPCFPLVGGGRRLIQPVLVDDLAAVPGRLLDHPATVRRCYCLPGRKAVTFAGFVEAAASACGRRLKLVSVPAPLARGAAAVAERILPRPLVHREQIERLLEDKDFEWEAARRDFGYDPAPIERGLALEVERLREGGERS